MFTAQDAARLVGISLGRIRYLDRLGIVKPAGRKGRKRLYGLVELITLDLTETLLVGGIAIRRFRRRLEAILGLIRRIALPHGNLVVLCEKETLRWQVFPDHPEEHGDFDHRVKYSAEHLREKVERLFPGILQPQLRIL